MAKNELQRFIWVVCDQLWLDKKILLVENIQDVPKEYLEIHMLTNALKHVKSEYEKQNKSYLDAFRHFSYKHRKGEISTWEFQSRFEKFQSKNSNRELVIS